MRMLDQFLVALRISSVASMRTPSASTEPSSFAYARSRAPATQIKSWWLRDAPVWYASVCALFKTKPTRQRELWAHRHKSFARRCDTTCGSRFLRLATASKSRTTALSPTRARVAQPKVVSFGRRHSSSSPSENLKQYYSPAKPEAMTRPARARRKVQTCHPMLLCRVALFRDAQHANP